MKPYIVTFSKSVAMAMTLPLALVACTEKPVDVANGNAANTTEALATSPAWTHSYGNRIVLAINVGGAQYEGTDGIIYQADALPLDAPKGTVDKVLGSQDPALYQSYRVGPMAVSLPVDNGQYDVTLKFIEPFDIPVGERVFDIKAENQTVVSNLDVRLARDGNHHSSLVKTVPAISVEDNSLDLAFEGKVGEPVLSAIIVRQAPATVEASNQQWTLVWQDEFDYQGPPDPSKWSFDIWPARKVNDEDQTYTDRPKNARVENGHLVIEAHKEDYQGAEYTSARLHTLGTGDWLYGRIDVRAKLAPRARHLVRHLDVAQRSFQIRYHL